jgi:cell division protein FtsI (penicillin-binding protein 3)
VNPRTSILTRLYVLLTLLAILPVAVAVQLVGIYMGDSSELREAGVRQASSYLTIPAMRGTILDREGRTLAVNTALYEVALDPTRAGFSARAEALYTALSRQTGRPAGEFRRMVASRTSRQYVLLTRNLDEANKEAIEALNVPGLILTPRFARRYTYGRTAAHVLGHVDTDLTGLSGIEVQYDHVLRGVDGRQAVQRDRRGVVRAVVDGSVTEPVHGQELVLTIDLVLQSILQEELVRGVDEAGASWGTAIAMDPHTGAILALANAPDYDPNRAGAFPESARRNYAITDQLEPGSTFKLVTAVAALETGAITPSDTVDTGAGWRVFGGRTMRDSRAYGRITFGDAIAVSSNIAMAEISRQIEPGRFYHYARSLGFGQHTLVDLPGEESGRLHRPELWGGTTQTSMAIGYAVTATPLQLLTTYAALANGGILVRPHVLAERRDIVSGRVLWRAPADSVRRAFNRSTADTLRPYFERVVSTDGTARRAAVEGLRIAGKTGTSRIAEGGRYVSAHRASFVGMFPADRPEVAMIVVLDRPTRGYYGGTVSAPIFSRIAERWTAVQPALAGRRGEPVLASRAPAVVPDVRGLPQRVATTRLHAAGLLALQEGRRSSDAWRLVASQRPAPGDTVQARRAVRLASLQEDVSLQAGDMPDLVGLSARQAAAWLAHLGVAYRLEGTGRVVRQSASPGEPVPSEVLLTCR